MKKLIFVLTLFAYAACSKNNTPPITTAKGTGHIYCVIQDTALSRAFNYDLKLSESGATLSEIKPDSVWAHQTVDFGEWKPGLYDIKANCIRLRVVKHSFIEDTFSCERGVQVEAGQTYTVALNSWSK